MSQPRIHFYKLRDFGAKMNATVEFLRENIGRLFLNLLFIAGPLALILSIIFSNLMSSMTDMVGLQDSGEVLNVFAVLGGNYFMILLVSWVAVSMIVTITLTYVRLYNEGVAKETPVGDVLRLAIKKFGGVLLLGFLISMVTIIGFFLFIIPGIYLSVVLSIAFPIYMFEDISATEAFGKSFRLISGKWWSTFGLIFVTFLMAYAVQLVFSLPLMVVYLTNIFTLIEESANNPNDPTAVFNLFTNGYMTAAMAISFVGGYLTYSIPLIGLSYQYSNLVERKEGRGLLNEIEDFDKK